MASIICQALPQKRAARGQPHGVGYALPPRRLRTLAQPHAVAAVYHHAAGSLRTSTRATLNGRTPPPVHLYEHSEHSLP